jgi:hypothetical protein
MVPLESSCNNEHTYEIRKPYHLPFKRYGQCSSFWKVGQISRSRGQNVWYQQKGLVIRNTHMKYESPITYHSKDMANVESFCRQTDRPKTICPRSFYGGIKIDS